jgi:hypothetical protein
MKPGITDMCSASSLSAFGLPEDLPWIGSSRLPDCPNVATVYCFRTRKRLCTAHEKAHLAALGCPKGSHVQHRVGETHS